MRLQHVRNDRRTSRLWSPDIMRDELSHALVEAMYELEMLPTSQDAAIIGIYAVMDDLRKALERTEKLDRLQRQN